jgi:chromosome segregation ATPase
MSAYSPFEQEVLASIKSIDQKVSSLDQKVSSLEGDIKSLKKDVHSLDERVTNLDKTMSSGFDRLENLVLDTRDESRAESRATRTLLDQAFQHISDHLVHQDTPDFVPKSRYPRIP